MATKSSIVFFFNELVTVNFFKDLFFNYMVVCGLSTCVQVFSEVQTDRAEDHLEAELSYRRLSAACCSCLETRSNTLQEYSVP